MNDNLIFLTAMYSVLCMSVMTVFTCMCIRAVWKDIHEWRKEKDGEQL